MLTIETKSHGGRIVVDRLGHLARRRPELTPDEVKDIHGRLSAALA